MTSRLGWFALAMAVLACASSSGCSGGDSKRINGAGSSFVKPMMDHWAKAFHKEKGLELNYQSKGSSAGIEQMIDRSVDFGCTDAPMNDVQLKKAKETGGDVVHIPLVMGAVVVTYNLDGIDKPIRFTGPVLADIFMRKISRWNDPQLAGLNPGVSLPDREIKVVRRSDGSGTTYIFTEFLSKVSAEWKEKIGFGTSVRWAEGTSGEKGSEGVSTNVKNTPGAITYVELIYALETKMKYGAVQNKEKEFVLASLESVTEAASNSLKSIPDDLRYSLTDAEGKQSYPIAGTVWAVVYANQSKGKGEKIVTFLRWVTHEGQDLAKELHYARLPQGLIERIDQKLKEIKVGS